MRRKKHLRATAWKAASSRSKQRGGGDVPASSRGEEDSRPPVCANVCVCTHTCVYVYEFECVCVFVCMCMHICVVCLCVCMHMYSLWCKYATCWTYKICLPKHFCLENKSQSHSSFLWDCTQGLVHATKFMLSPSSYTSSSKTPTKWI